MIDQFILDSISKSIAAKVGAAPLTPAPASDIKPVQTGAGTEASYVGGTSTYGSIGGSGSKIGGIEAGTWVTRFDFLQRMSEDIGMGGEVLKAMAGNPKYAEAIEYWKQEGVIDAQFNVNQGQLIDKMEDFQTALAEVRTFKPITPEQQTGYKDAYAAAVNKKIDPKLVQITDLGDGVKKTTILNADGKTPAQSFVTGSITLENGQTVDNVTFIGSSRADWSKMEEVAKRTKNLFPDALNGGSEQEKAKDLPLGYVDPRTIEGYDAGLGYMGGFAGGAQNAPLSAENAARKAQGLRQIGPESMWAPKTAEELAKEEANKPANLPGGLANLPGIDEIAAIAGDQSAWGGGTGGEMGAPMDMVSANLPAEMKNSYFSGELKRLGGVGF